VLVEERLDRARKYLRILDGHVVVRVRDHDELSPRNRVRDEAGRLDGKGIDQA
jgi:hypothetical protein